MNRPKLYQKTVDILYQAYFNDTLKHRNCQACAVGNIVAANMGFSYKPYTGVYGKCIIVWDLLGEHENDNWAFGNFRHSNGWPSAFFTSDGYQRMGKANTSGKLQIRSTGYFIKELAKVEFAFETAPKGDNDEDWMFNGLVAVLEVLKQIHGVTDEDLLQANNKRFADYHKLKTCAV